MNNFFSIFQMSKVTSKKFSKRKSKGINPKANITTASTSEGDDVFEPKTINKNSRAITFKPCIMSKDEALFLNTVYSFQPITTCNTLTLCVMELFDFLHKYGFEFYICKRHGLLKIPNMDCMYCTSFSKYSYVFLLETKYHLLTFPPPAWYQPKVLNFLKTFCCSSTKYNSVKTLDDGERELEIKSYSLFVNMNFNDGNLKDLSTGKTSYVRNSILGFHSLGGRATLSIDCTLSPQYVILPQNMFDAMDMATNLVLVNRAPSLKGTCIYALEALRNDNPNDYTIRINAYICEGLHADQDGDELSIFYIQHPGTNKPSHEIEMAISELKRMSWDGGVRHDLTYMPRYELTQYHKFILHQYNDYFCSVNKLWASIGGSPREKCKIIMHLGCSIYVKEVDAFIQQLSDFIKKLDIQMVPCDELLAATGTINAVVESGAKGEKIHIKTYLNRLYNLNDNRLKDLIENFNKYIHSGTNMSRQGTYQFQYLEMVNGLNLTNESVHYNDRVIFRNALHETSMASYQFNAATTKYVIEYIAQHSPVTDEECDTYLASLEGL
nr:LEF-9 [Menippe mercenaria nudivirus]